MKIPIVDIQTKKISGCKKNTFEYFHEEAHIEYSEDKALLCYILEQCEFWAIVFLSLSFFVNFFKYFALTTTLLMIALFTYEEVYCNFKAKEKMNKKVYK